MKVYIVAMQYGYQEYSEPMRAFPTEEAAREYVGNTPCTEIFEMDVEEVEA